VLDHEQLLKVTVEQLQEKFGYYHVHIYLLDEAQQKLVVVAGTGSAGTHMVANRHSINLKAPTSLVAQSARSGSIVWLDNVQESPIWLPNPLLPNTRAEMAVPIIIDGQVAGVLDVQENRVRGFDEGDASLLRSLASQAAVAIRNARLFGQVEKALAEARLAQERYMQEAWAGAGTGALTGNHQFQQPDVLPPDKAITDQLHRLARRFKQAVVLGPDQPTPAEIENEPPLAVQGSVMVAPIKVQNQTVGAIQLHHPEGDHRWAELDLALVQVVSDQVAQVAENLRLFEDTRQRARREHTIRQITEKMRSATSLHHLVEITAHELATHFSAGHTLIELGMEPEPANGEAQEQ
jgi:GAF domain-containing protein